MARSKPAALPDALLTEEAAPLVGKSPSTLKRWRMRPGGPPYLKVGGCILYPRGELMKWLAGRLQTSTSDRRRAA